ncbi:MAG: molybdopterin cofactor-binding domain-containing protein [Bacteroidota bacterium]
MNNDDYLAIDFTDNEPDFQLNRRDFLKLTSGVLVLFTIGDTEAFAQQTRPSLPTDFNAFLRIGEDGRVSCFTGKIEMGQGVHTSLAQMLADELDVSLDSIEMIMGDTDLCPWDAGTYGSMSTRGFGPALRAAGAEAKQVMSELAAEYLNIPIDQLIIEKGEVFDKTNKLRSVTYAQLAKGKKIERHLTQAAIKKMPSEFKIMGKPTARRDAKDKVTGKAKYTGDIQIPGMVYAKILRPPAHGSKLVDVDLSEVNKIKDVQVIREGDFIAVLHKYPDVAETALSKIKANYERPQTGIDDKNIFDHLLKNAPEGKSLAKEGNLQEGEKLAAKVVEETYLDGYKAHSPIEPHTAIARIEGNKATIWASAQTPFPTRNEVAKELGLPPENVRVIAPFLGGGFGGKGRNLQAVEAARCARLSGKPVQLAWTRKEEFFNDSFRPAAIVKIRSGATEKGDISFWDYHVYFAGERGSQTFYSIPHHSTISHNSNGVSPTDHPFVTGPWRAPANNTNTFARESQMDIMAAKLGMDPVEFRLQNLKNEKLQTVLKTAAEKFGWKPSKSPSGRGFGVACGIDAGTLVATCAEVEVNKSTGEVKVKRVVCAQDMGLVINPEGAIMQMEGCITMGMGYALKEDIHFKDGEIFDVNFDSYEIPRFSWLPKIETYLVDNKSIDPQGGGEPAIVVMGAVLANAIHDAIGVRVFQMPMTPQRIKDALKKG